MHFLYLGWKACRTAPYAVTDSLVMSEGRGFTAPRTEREGEGGKSGRCRRMHQHYLKKVTRFPAGTRLSLKQTRKELMSALIRVQPAIDGEPQSVGLLPRSACTWGRGGEGGGLWQPRAQAPLSEICLSSSFLPPAKRLWLDIRLRKSIPLQSPGWPMSMPCIVELLIKCMQA